MSRPRTIRSEKILTAARRLFLEGGYGVSTADIARAAGVSEGSIFKRFGTKSGLFHAAMGLPPLDIEAVVERARAQDDVRAALVTIGHEIVAFQVRLLPRMMMLWAQPSLNPLEVLRDAEGEAPPQRLLRAVVDFMERTSGEGRLRAGRDPSVPARLLLGALHGYVFFHLIEGREPDEEQVRSHVEDVVDALWEGIRPR